MTPDEERFTGLRGLVAETQPSSRYQREWQKLEGSKNLAILAGL